MNSCTEPIFAGFAMKLIVNAISTGANILKGRVYGNTMINLTLANDKVHRHRLWHTVDLHVHVCMQNQYKG